MTALTAPLEVPWKLPDLQAFPVAATTTIYKGSKVCLNTAGFAVAGADTAGYKYIGEAYETVDNSAGAAGDRSIRVHRTGIFKMTASSITQAMVGKLMYLVDSGTVDDNSTNFIIVGTLVQYESATVGYVDIGSRDGSALASGPANTIFVRKGGSAGGDGSELNPLSTVTAAFALVTASKKYVDIGPGVFAEAAALVWPAVDNVKVKGAGSSLTAISATGTSVISVAPGAVSSTFDATLIGVEIDHSAGAAQSGIKFDNTGMTKKLLFSMEDVIFTPDAVTDKSIDVATHGDADNAIRVYVKNDGTQKEIGGAIYFTVDNLADRLHLEGCWIIGTITTPNVAKEFRMRLLRCTVPHGAATAGGNATQVITAVACHSWIDYDDITPEVFAVLDSADLTGSHSEVIVS